MRFAATLPPLTIALLLTGCHPRDKETGAVAARVSDCVAIASPAQRLACFDAAAGAAQGVSPQSATAVSGASAAFAASTASAATTASRKPDGSVSRSAIAALVQRNEASRKSGDSQFVVSRWTDADPDLPQMVISAPAIGATERKSWLAISCKSGITRLQLLMQETLSSNRVRIRLLMDGHPISDATTWQVLETGDVVDAGRGLVAIDLLRRVGSGARLQIGSDYPSLDGLEFNANGLKDLIAQEREACHW